MAGALVLGLPALHRKAVPTVIQVDALARYVAIHGRIAAATPKPAYFASFPMAKCYQSLCLDIARFLRLSSAHERT
jgi:hypothetical protein